MRGSVSLLNRMLSEEKSEVKSEEKPEVKSEEKREYKRCKLVQFSYNYK